MIVNVVLKLTIVTTMKKNKHYLASSPNFSMVEINDDDFHDVDDDGDVDFNDVKETKIAGLSKFSKFLNG